MKMNHNTSKAEEDDIKTKKFKSFPKILMFLCLPISHFPCLFYYLVSNQLFIKLKLRGKIYQVHMYTHLLLKFLSFFEIRH